MVKMGSANKSNDTDNIIMTLHYVTVSIKVYTWIESSREYIKQCHLSGATNVLIYLSLSLYLCFSSFSNIC